MEKLINIYDDNIIPCIILKFLTQLYDYLLYIIDLYKSIKIIHISEYFEEHFDF